MGKWGHRLRGFGFMAAKFVVATAFIVTVAAIAKYAL
jgi:hypothetical protein